jgi:hypothetical protein
VYAVISRKWLLVGLVLGLALLALAAYAGVKACLPGLTEAHWRQVEPGMPRHEVEALLGVPRRTFPIGRVVEGLKQGFPATTETLSLWSGADTPFSVAMVGFDAHERVTHTRAFGLPAKYDTEFVKWRRWLFYR